MGTVGVYTYIYLSIYLYLSIYIYAYLYEVVPLGRDGTPGVERGIDRVLAPLELVNEKDGNGRGR